MGGFELTSPSVFQSQKKKTSKTVREYAEEVLAEFKAPVMSVFNRLAPDVIPSHCYDLRALLVTYGISVKCSSCEKLIHYSGVRVSECAGLFCIGCAMEDRKSVV